VRWHSVLGKNRTGAARLRDRGERIESSRAHDVHAEPTQSAPCGTAERFAASRRQYFAAFWGRLFRFLFGVKFRHYLLTVRLPN
jgi:hypothetical protein